MIQLRSPTAALLTIAKRESSQLPSSNQIRKLFLYLIMIIGVTSVIFSIYIIIIRDFFTFNEARSYIVWRGWLDNVTISRIIFFPTGTLERFTGRMFAALIAEHCGLSNSCARVFDAGVLALAGGALFVHGALSLRSLKLSIFAVTFWTLSSASLSSVILQSVFFDKLSVLFVSTTMAIAFISLWVNSLSRFSLCLLQICILISVVLSLNAKEPAFMILPLMIYLGIWFWAETGRLRRALFVIGPTILYTGWFITQYFRLLDETWALYIASGSPMVGASRLFLLAIGLDDFLNLGRWGNYYEYTRMISIVLYLAFLGISLSLGIRYLYKSLIATNTINLNFKDTITSYGREGYFILITVIAVAGTARHAFPAPFHMIIATWSGFCVAMLFLIRWTSDLSRPRLAAGGLILLLFIPFILMFSTHLLEGGAVRRLSVASREFSRSVNAVSSILEGKKVNEIRIYVEGAPDGEWYLLKGISPDASIDPDLGPYFLNDPNMRPRIVDVRSKSNLPLPGPGTVDLALSRHYLLHSMSFAGRQLFSVSEVR